MDMFTIVCGLAVERIYETPSGRLGLNKVDAIDYLVQSGQSKQRPVDITHAHAGILHKHSSLKYGVPAGPLKGC